MRTVASNGKVDVNNRAKQILRTRTTFGFMHINTRTMDIEASMLSRYRSKVYVVFVIGLLFFRRLENYVHKLNNANDSKLK